ncbi:MAG TPA: C4-type zinc ribbon domain-containing protein [Verrucomicrobiae bacterium]|nr:C4-type zinc ribbon domain-containing protein [Verrucomicrobiae bacterium]
MREQIEILASLQNVDREIKDKNLAKTVLTDEIRKREEEIALKKHEVAQLKAEWTEREKVRREKDTALQDEGRKATDKRMRMTRIKNIRELQALQHEVDQIKQQNSILEEELITIMEDLDARAAVLHEREEELKTLEQAWNEQKAALQAQVAQLDKEVAETASGRQSIASRLNGDLIGRYETIFRARGGTAVVGVTDGICQGCYMNIPPQLANEIRKNERLNLCPSCHRILFYKPSEPAENKHA